MEVEWAVFRPESELTVQGNHSWGAAALLSSLDQLPCLVEHGVQHRAGEPSGEGVLLAGVVAGEQMEVCRKLNCSPVGELGFRPSDVPSCFRPGRQQAIEGDVAQSDHGSQVSKRGKFPNEVGTARNNLGPGRFVAGRCTAYDGSNVGPDELEAIAACTGLRLIREAMPMHGLEQPIPTSITGEHPSCAVPTMRSRCQPHDQEPPVWVTERGNRSAPISLIGEPLRLASRHFLPVRDQPRTDPASHHIVLDSGELRLRTSHPNQLGGVSSKRGSITQLRDHSPSVRCRHTMPAFSNRTT